MADEVPLLAGRVETGLDLHRFAALLCGTGIRAEVRESYYFEGGRYIRVYEGDVHFDLERINAQEYLVRADADTLEQLCWTAWRVSSALADLDIRHRFEVCDQQCQLARYLHHG
jgi:hypothetical protein